MNSVGKRNWGRVERGKKKGGINCAFACELKDEVRLEQKLFLGFQIFCVTTEILPAFLMPDWWQPQNNPLLLLGHRFLFCLFVYLTTFSDILSEESPEKINKITLVLLRICNVFMYFNKTITKKKTWLISYHTFPKLMVIKAI